MQNTQLNLAEAASLVSGTIELLNVFRTNIEWDKVYNYAKSVYETHVNNIEVASNIQQSRCRQLPSRYEDSVVTATTGHRDRPDSKEKYKVTVYLPVIDSFLSELNRRFSDKNMEIMSGIQACYPNHIHFLDYDLLKPLADMYKLNQAQLNLEVNLAKHTLADKNLESVSDTLLTLLQVQSAFPVLTKLVHIAMTIAVSTAECERSFSTLKRIKTYLRSTMTENRLNNLAVLSIEQDISLNLSMDDIVDEFAVMKDHRIILK